MRSSFIPQVAGIACCLLISVSPTLAAASDLQHIKFASDSSPGESVTLRFSHSDHAYLKRLRATYRLDSIVKHAASDFDRVQVLSGWVRSQWEHNGSNEPLKSDPISILEEAKQGKRFRCVEYAIVLAGALNAVGIPARVLGLMTSDVETREFGAGHVVAEAYLSDQQKWVMVDGQWDAIPMQGDKPLSAVEFALALQDDWQALDVLSLPAESKTDYFRWIQPYLFYFRSFLDNRIDRKEGAPGLMLVPLGARNPTVFQIKYPLGALDYTHSPAGFYSAPVIEDRPG